MSTNDYLMECLRSDDWEPILDVINQYDSFDDFPWPYVYPRIDSLYPGSKYILTTRISSEVWFKSLVKHAERTGPTRMKVLAYGYPMPQDAKQEHINLYEKHNQDARLYFSGRDADYTEVCWERGDDWKKICDFLGEKVPDMPMPWENKAPMLSRRMRMLGFLRRTKASLRQKQ